MAFPYNLWQSPQHYAVPAILPSSNPLIQNPEGAIRDFVEHYTNGDRTSLCDANQLKWFEEWAKSDDYRKIIMDVLKTRLDLGWPYAYKALDILAVMPSGELVGLNDKITKLNEGTGEGSAENKKLIKPMLEKIKGEIGKQEAEEMKKKEEAVMAMWGGMWANNGFVQPQLAQQGWGGVPYPYSAAGIVPGVPHPQVEWKSKAPEGWQPASITPVPQIYPFSRTGYYGWIPEPTPPPEPPKQAGPGWWVGVHMGPPNSRKLPVSKKEVDSIDIMREEAEKARLRRGW